MGGIVPGSVSRCILDGRGWCGEQGRLPGG